MNMLLHNLKVAWRNLMKYKFQTVISVLSIAIGIVTLDISHVAVSRFKLPTLYSQPYYKRAYSLEFDSIGNTSPRRLNAQYQGIPSVSITPDIIRSLKRDGGLRVAERIAVPNGSMEMGTKEFHLCDSTVRRAFIYYRHIDSEYLNYIGLRSAISGEKIRPLKPGEAIISKKEAARIFGQANPIGAVCSHSGFLSNRPVTIVDIYDDVSVFDQILDNRTLYYAVEDIETTYAADVSRSYTITIKVVLKEGCTEQQLQDEVDARVRPLGLQTILTKEADNKDVSAVIAINAVVHLLGSLILLAAIIGYMRMQIQLMWSRRREMSLRITNGARRRELLGLMLTEVLLTIGITVVVAIVMGEWIETLINTRFDGFLNDWGISIQNLFIYSLYTGIILAAVCSMAIWIALSKICNNPKGLAENMRSGRTHLFRNIMLGFQITISLIFVCATMFFINWSAKVKVHFNVPDNDDFYKQCVLMKLEEVEQREQLMEEVKRMPDLDKIIGFYHFYLCVEEVKESPEATAALKYQTHFPFYCTGDSSLISFYGAKVKWHRRPTENEPYLLINDSIYKRYQELGIGANGCLTINQGWPDGPHSIPIAGTIANLPYDEDQSSIIFTPGERALRYILIPKAGKYASLMREVNQIIHRVEPAIVDKLAVNFRESNMGLAVTEGILTVALILGAVSLIICAMSVYSTIALDTRSRKKEMAIRMVHGAKGRDIYSLFGRMYIILICCALTIALPVLLLFQRAMAGALMYFDTVSAVSTCLTGTLVIVVMIALIVIYNIRKIMATNPAEMIAKE